MKKTLSAFLCIIIVLGMCMPSFAFGDNTVNAMVNDTADYIYKTVTNPQIASIGGEWAVLGLIRSGAEIPQEYYENYYNNVKNYLKENNGILHEKKYTEYSRVIIALTAIGKNPADVEGYNLLSFISDYEKTIWQGINGAIWALIALDSKDYEMPDNANAAVLATRQMYIDHILQNQTLDGGWALSGDNADADITAMALCALSKYQNDERVKEAIQKALLCMSNMQNENAGFASMGQENCEGSAQMIVALCSLGIPLDDARFVKNGKTMLDNLITYYEEGNGFKHIYDASSSNLMATEQCFYSLVALKRFNEGKNSLYNISDVETVSDKTVETVYLAGKNSDIKKMEIVYEGKTFEDIKGHKNQSAIEKLSERGIINGKTDSMFEPDSTMTRAEFATIIVRGLGLDINKNAVFSDVTKDDWFFDYVNSAYSYGIVNGVSENTFNPNGTITRQEACVMVARCAKLCGFDTEITVFDARNILAGFSDYVKVSDWAVSSLAFCYDKKILQDDVMEIKPHEDIKRAEIAQMLYNMLSIAKLL